VAFLLGNSPFLGGDIEPSSLNGLSQIVSVFSQITSTMVNVPKTRKTYCKGPKCRRHTNHKVTQYKKGKDSVFAQGAFGA